MYQFHYSASNARNLETTKTHAKDNKCVADMEKKMPHLVLKMIARMIAVFSKICNKYRREKEILQVTHKKCIVTRSQKNS